MKKVEITFGSLKGKQGVLIGKAGHGVYEVSIDGLGIQYILEARDFKVLEETK